jgi:ATP synthase F0 subunit b
VSIHGTTFLIELVNFVVLVFVLQRLFYRPLREVMQRREAQVRQKLDAAEQTQKTVEALRDEVSRERRQLEAERRSVLDEARKESLAERDRIVAEAREDAAREVERGQGLLDRERDAVRARLHDDVLAEVVHLTESTLEAIGAKAVCDSLASRLVDYLENLPSKEVDRLRAAAKRGIRVRVRGELGDASAATLLGALVRFGGGEPVIEPVGGSAEPETLGILLDLGTMQLDATLRGVLGEVTAGSSTP